MNFGKYFGKGVLVIIGSRILFGRTIGPIIDSYKSDIKDLSFTLMMFGIMDFIIEVLLLMIFYKTFYEKTPKWYFGPIALPILSGIIVKILLLILFINSGF